MTLLYCIGAPKLLSLHKLYASAPWRIGRKGMEYTLVLPAKNGLYLLIKTAMTKTQQFHPGSHAGLCYAMILCRRLLVTISSTLSETIFCIAFKPI